MNNFLDIEYWKVNVDCIVEDKLIEYLDFISKSYCNDDDTYCEVHHIIPVSILPEAKKDKNNLIRLEASNHFVVHRMLKDCFTGENKRKMSFAYSQMCNCRDRERYNISDDDYAIAKEISSLNVTGENNPTKRKDVQLTMSKNHRDVSGDNNPMKKRGGWSEEERKEISRRKIESGVSAGENNPMYGKTGEDNPNYGRTAINKDGIGKRVKQPDLQSYLDDGWVIGALPKKKQSKKGYIWVTNGVKDRTIPLNKLNKFIKDGYHQGRTNY